MLHDLHDSTLPRTRVILAHIVSMLVILLYFGISLFLLWLTGWGELPPRAWRDFSAILMEGGPASSLFGYGVDAVFPLLLSIFMLLTFPIVKNVSADIVEKLVRKLEAIPIAQSQESEASASIPELSLDDVTTSPVSIIKEALSEATLYKLAEPDKDVPVSSLDSPSLTHSKKHRATTGNAKVCISMLGEMKVWIEHNEERIYLSSKSQRRLQLLAYIASMAPVREKAVSSGRILTDVFVLPWSQADADMLRPSIEKEVQLLHEELNETVQSAGLPHVELIQCEKIGNGSTKWWLSDECKIIDLPAVKLLFEQMEGAKEQGEAGMSTLKSAADQLIELYQSYQGDYLEKCLLHEEFSEADWMRGPFTEYRDMYLQALWDAAGIEYNASVQLNRAAEQRSRSAKRAALLYKTYALHVLKNQHLDLHPEKNKRQSERALRGFLRACRWSTDLQAIDSVCSAYEELMAEQFPGWKPSQQTIEILQGVRRQSDYDIPLLNQLEPVEE